MKTLTIAFVLFHAIVHSSSQCTEGWTLFGGSCYYYDSTPIRIPEIEPKCASLGASLVQIKSEAQLEFLKSKGVTSVLLGTKRVAPKKYLWSDGSPIPAEKWHPGYPECTGDCCAVLLNDKDGLFFDTKCTETTNQLCVKPVERPVISEMGSRLKALEDEVARLRWSKDDKYYFRSQCTEGWHHFRGSCYYYDSTEIRIPEIEPKCASLGASLVQIKSEAQLEFLKSKGVINALLGTKRVAPKKYLWSDGTPIPVEKWHSRHPSCTGDCCAVSLNHEDGLYWDLECNNTRRQLCVKAVSPGIGSRLKALEEEVARLRWSKDDQREQQASREKTIQLSLDAMGQRMTKIETKLEKVLHQMHSK